MDAPTVLIIYDVAEHSVLHCTGKLCDISLLWFSEGNIEFDTGESSIYMLSVVVSYSFDKIIGKFVVSLNQLNPSSLNRPNPETIPSITDPALPSHTYYLWAICYHSLLCPSSPCCISWAVNLPGHTSCQLANMHLWSWVESWSRSADSPFPPTFLPCVSRGPPYRDPP